MLQGQNLFCKLRFEAKRKKIILSNRSNVIFALNNDVEGDILWEITHKKGKDSVQPLLPFDNGVFEDGDSEDQGRHKRISAQEQDILQCIESLNETGARSYQQILINMPHNLRSCA